LRLRKELILTTIYKADRNLLYACLASINDFALQEVGVEIEPFADLNTEAERKLGQLVLEK